MTEFIQTIKGVGLAGVVVRMFLAVLCGGIIGLERESKRRSAGFRTHTLICIGATLTTLTSQYLMGLGLTTDPARLGAQVIAGMGFIGAGAIIVTSRRQVKGLTTAAGLWDLGDNWACHRHGILRGCAHHRGSCHLLRGGPLKA